jgi:ribosomal protein S12 methylthiotransferase
MSDSQPPAKVHLVSLGCPKNTVDSERMLGLIEANSFEITADPEDADVVVVNTCGFIEAAKEESLEAVMAAHRLKEEGRCKGVIVTGCLAQRYHETLSQELIEADQLLTLDQESQIVPYLDRLLGNARSRLEESAPRSRLTPRHWSYLRISDGCDHKCAFCAIPLIKGRHRSEPLESLLAEAERLAATGVRELVLVSQDSVRYGADLYGRSRLVSLIDKLSRISGIEWIRLMYVYPAFWTDEMIELFATNEKVCTYIDMPLQHIADSVLQRMKRATTKKRTLDLLDRLRSRMPTVGLRSTFIVGFPGETEEEFEELLEFVEQTRFDHLSGFLFSREDGTASCTMEEQVPETIKEERYSRLTELQEQISYEINSEYIGTRQHVLVDEYDPDNNLYCGRLERDAPEIDGQVVIEGAAEAGRFVEVEIIGAHAFELEARVQGASW